MQKDILIQRLKELCAKEKITITELERTLGFSASSIARWGSVNPSIDRVSIVAEYFGVSTDYLIGRTNVPTTVDQTLSDPDLVAIQRLRNNLSTRNKKKMMQLLELQFEEDFFEDKDNTNDKED